MKLNRLENFVDGLPLDKLDIIDEKVQNVKFRGTAKQKSDEIYDILEIADTPEELAALAFTLGAYFSKTGLLD